MYFRPVAVFLLFNPLQKILSDEKNILSFIHILYISADICTVVLIQRQR